MSKSFTSINYYAIILLLFSSCNFSHGLSLTNEEGMLIATKGLDSFE